VAGAARRNDGSAPVARTSAAAALIHVRKLCLALPDVTERPSHSAPCFFVRDKATFLMFHDNHHGDGKLALWCAAPEGAQETLIAADPENFFRPAYVGHRGWIGVRLDRRLDWGHIAALIDDAYGIVASKMPRRRATAKK
jgi:hypothetical protein